VPLASKGSHAGCDDCHAQWLHTKNTADCPKRTVVTGLGLVDLLSVHFCYHVCNGESGIHAGSKSVGPLLQRLANLLCTDLAQLQIHPGYVPSSSQHLRRSGLKMAHSIVPSLRAREMRLNQRCNCSSTEMRSNSMVAAAAVLQFVSTASDDMPCNSAKHLLT